jgi:hypothetical protein
MIESLVKAEERRIVKKRERSKKQSKKKVKLENTKTPGARIPVDLPMN